jgi:hypothetical protein
MHKKGGVGAATTLETFQGLEMGVLAPHAEHVSQRARICVSLCGVEMAWLLQLG